MIWLSGVGLKVSQASCMYVPTSNQSISHKTHSLGQKRKNAKFEVHKLYGSMIAHHAGTPLHAMHQPSRSSVEPLNP